METDAEEAEEVIEAATEEAVEEEEIEATEVAIVAPVVDLEVVTEAEEETERFLLTQHYAFSY